jgi:hypothetical protein
VLQQLEYQKLNCAVTSFALSQIRKLYLDDLVLAHPKLDPTNVVVDKARHFFSGKTPLWKIFSVASRFSDYEIKGFQVQKRPVG